MTRILPILIFPEPRLRGRAKPVIDFNPSLDELVATLLKTMYAAPGIGLAATQVGIMQRVAVVDLGEESGMDKPLILINPEITWRSTETSSYEEGCLSLPDFYEPVSRPQAIKLRNQTSKGESRTLNAEGLLATCIQHEMDHLDGVLFIDYLTPLKRNMIERKLRKQKRLAETL
ncbi:MAG: peptide deformylase [Candidatus Pacebacteria bacterium]|nr:peptide deformylase [Candidatus Paceibacterota bacterium]